MLLRFSVRNYRSLATEQEVVLTATNLDDSARGLIHVENFKHDVLPVIVMYGPNASGKSNMLKALNFMIAGVRGSHAAAGAGKKIARKKYLLGDCAESDSTSLELDFILRSDDDATATRYTYGFVISDEAVEEEWLYAYPNGHRQVWFHRSRADSPEFHFGRALKGQNRITAELTRPSSLFLSSAFASNHQQLAPIFEFITGGFLVRLDNLTFDEKSPVVQFLEDDDLRDRLLSVLRNADTGICEANVREMSISEKEVEISKAVAEVLQSHFPESKTVASDITGPTKKTVQLGHAGKGKTIFFPLAEESRGTLAFLELMGMVLVTLGSGGILVVDEFDSSLHPALSKQVVSLFNSKKSNPKGAQLIFTTHDASILSRDILRRDQIYFVEKDAEGKSNVYPLIRLKTKKGDNIQKGYLEGRFGAIPFLGDFEALVGEVDGEKAA